MIKKTRSIFKLCGEDIIPKFDRLIAPYNFITISNQTTFNFLSFFIAPYNFITIFNQTTFNFLIR
jgi:hypothetical protein